MSTNIGLIAEGGGMRAAYTGGILEAFLDHDITFPYAIGVSAGANSLCSYLSKQKLRNKRIYTEWITDKRFISLRNLWKERAYFGMDFLFNELPTTLDPFDFDTFKKSKTLFKVGVTNCLTGQCEYLEPIKMPTLDEADRILQASSSLPFIAKMVPIKDQLYLDGGITDSIPIKQAISDGFARNVIVLTRNADYRKTYSKKMDLFAKHRLKKYPQLAAAIGNRYIGYNETLDFIAQLEAAGDAFVLRPEQPLAVDRFEKDSDKLRALYEQGYDQAYSHLNDLKAFITQAK